MQDIYIHQTMIILSKESAPETLQVQDLNNNEFLLKLLAVIGLVVPPTSYPEQALITIAKNHSLLGDGAENSDIEALTPGNSIRNDALSVWK